MSVLHSPTHNFFGLCRMNTNLASVESSDSYESNALCDKYVPSKFIFLPKKPYGICRKPENAQQPRAPLYFEDENDIY